MNLIKTFIRLLEHLRNKATTVKLVYLNGKTFLLNIIIKNPSEGTLVSNRALMRHIKSDAKYKAYTKIWAVQ